MGTTVRSSIKAAYALYSALVVLAAAPAHAAPTGISDTPVFLTVAVPPNVTVTLDDSGSMSRAFVPEKCPNLGDMDCTVLDNRYEKSAKNNLIFYNPTIKYPVPKTAAGADRTTSFTAAYHNGFDTTLGTVNLSTSYQPSAAMELTNGTVTHRFMGHYASDARCDTSTNVCQITNGSGGWTNLTKACSGTNNTRKHESCRGTHGASGSPQPAPAPAYYYVFDATNDGSCASASAADKPITNACYDIVFVSATSGPGGTDERQNFANWYSFSRTRNLATMTAASLSFATLNPDVRVAWQALNTCRGSTDSLVDTDCDGWRNNFSNISNRINTFSGTHKSNFYSWVAQLPTSGTTPLPQAMRRVGEYYTTAGENGPYDNDFTTNNSGQLSCRRNYHVMMTDGIWNNAVDSGNVDNTSIAALPDGKPYAPMAPYRDDHSNTLADTAFQYWSRDLNTGLVNELTPIQVDLLGSTDAQYWNPKNDPATWQHMVNFTIGLGLSGFLSEAGLTWGGDMYQGSYPDLLTGATGWPQADSTTNNPANVADLWHAAINSRGQFFSADDPASLSEAFRDALTAITGDTGSAAALSTNSTSVRAGQTRVYQARFNKDWSGTLLAYEVLSTGKIGELQWDASDEFPAHADRNIFTYNDEALKGTEFSSCSNLSASQQTLLGGNSLCSGRLQWLRGDPAGEVRNGGSFRNRLSSIMGDIINSDPAYVKDIDYGYSSLPGYDGYLSANASRTAVVYVGANDGQMHAFDARTGVEKFAYVPSGVYENLSELTDPSYAHRYYVDGGITAGDAYLGGSWKTIVIAGLNAGGKSVYALDVTDPDAFDETKVMWEFTDSDLGLTYSQPQIGVLESGEWVAIFGNGYNSTSEGAHLYIVDLATGALLSKITADSGSSQGNGLSTPVLFDADGDALIDAVYAGDLLGNLWKFDVTTLPGSVAYGRAVFTAPSGQAITSQPKVAAHPSGGQMIIFGTGRYLSVTDVSDDTTQSFYGIRDDGAVDATITRADLAAQAFDLLVTSSGRRVRASSANTVDWANQQGWYLDLLEPQLVGPAIAVGERVISTPIIRDGRAIIVSMIPSIDPCKPGGTSWLIEVDLVTGGSSDGGDGDGEGDGGSNTDKCVIDVNGDGKFDTLDLAASGRCPSAIELTVGISKTPVWLDDDETDEIESIPVKLLTGTKGTIETIGQRDLDPPEEEEPPPAGTLRRRSWIQIR